jgi:hypothetical protein
LAMLAMMFGIHVQPAYAAYGTELVGRIDETLRGEGKIHNSRSSRASSYVNNYAGKCSYCCSPVACFVSRARCPHVSNGFLRYRKGRY